MRAIYLIFTLLICFNSYSQLETPYKYLDSDPTWVKYMYSDNPNINKLRELVEQYYSNHDFIKSKHTQYFKRILKNYAASLNTDGTINKHKPQGYAVVKSPTSPWQEVGPWDYDHEQAMEFEVQSPGSAHVYTVEQNPLDPQLVYAGTATAGLWKSIDKGLNWTLVTKDYDINGVYSIAFDSMDVDIVYFGETNGQIWKTIDGGVTWNMTGNATFQSTNYFVRDLKLIAPDILLAATDISLYRSNDAGNTWLEVNFGEHMEIELRPDNNQIIYSVKQVSNRTELFTSLDNGLTWNNLTTGWPDPGNGDEQKRTEISVTAANPDLIYAFCAGDVDVDGGFYGLYKSIDGGLNFTFECCGGMPGGAPTVSNPNILGWSEDGTEGGGQYYYDLAFGVSPTNEQRMFGAGINTWRSINAGNNWTLNAHWVSWVGANTKHRYTHADVHDIKFFEHAGGVDMWVASDGGLYYSSNQGDTLVPRMHGIHGTDFWGFQAGFKDGDVMLGGTYHNGTLIKYNEIYKGGLIDPNQDGWLAELGGDNYRGFVNYGDSKIAYTDNGSFEFSEVREVRKTDRAFQGDKKCNTSYVLGEYGNYGFSPNNYNTFYSPVGNELFKTVNGGVSFELVHDFGGNKLIQVKVSWSNPNVIYVTHKATVNGSNFKIMKSVDAGSTWEDVTPPSGVTNNFGNNAKYIEVDDKDANKIWCILMGGHTGYKVFQSNDGGNIWSNITTSSIENENVISIVHHYGSNDGLYIGTRKNVYYKNMSMTDWTLFNNNLPASTSCVFLQPFYGENKIRTATQRGVYECEFYETAPPIAMPAANATDINLSANCLSDTIQYVDHSTVSMSTATWYWEFEGGIPATSTEENPKVVYTAPGSYGVKLVVTDEFGADSIEILNFITVTNSFNSPQISEDFNGTAFPPAGWKFEDSEGSSWEHDWPEGDDSDKVASFPNYWVDATGQSHMLVLPAVSFVNAQWANLSFDYTYNDNSGYTDSLAFVYRTGGNPNWQTLWQKGGSNLEVTGTDVWYWYDLGASINFENQIIDLSFLTGESCVEFAFSNIGSYGNHIWIDNVNLFGDFTGLEEESNNVVLIHPNPSNGDFSLVSNQEIVKLEIYDLTGKLIRSVDNLGQSAKFSLLNEPVGMYVVQAYSASSISTQRIIKQ